MNTVIFEPLKEFNEKLKDLHLENTTRFFEGLVTQSGVDVEENKKTVAEYNVYKENLAQLKRKLNWHRVLRVLMCITLILIPLVIWKTTPKIKELREAVAAADAKAEELLALAYQQMLPLNGLFTDRDSLQLIQQTVPLLSFDACFSVEREEDMKTNYDFDPYGDNEESTLEVLSGAYNENPFLFENRLIHTMGTETYHGYKNISWVETYRDSNGKLQTRTRHETLHASVVKPKPFYNTQVMLNYGSQGAPDLSFSRDASHLEQKGERALERHLKKGEKKLKLLTDKAIRENDDFTSMANTDFEVLFDALDRTDEVQFRSLFTPLAQTNMAALILSKVGYGDDFHFIKRRRMNHILTNHSQGRAMILAAKEYPSYSFDVIRDNFIQKNAEFFKAVYFDFAPILAIPAYQERPVHSLKPIPDYSQCYSLKECETLANAVDQSYVVHPETKTPAILKSTFVESRNKTDKTCITAYSYDIAQRVDVVSVRGGDGKYHNVAVTWDEYLPLVANNEFYVTARNLAQNQSIMASRNGLCIYR